VKIKVGVIDDNELVRIAVEEILNRASDLDVVGGFTGVGTLLESGRRSMYFYWAMDCPRPIPWLPWQS